MKLFRERFTCTVELLTEDVFCNFKYDMKNLQLNPSVAREVLYYDTCLRDCERLHLSPWITLQCYLESTLQMGTIHEIIGNGVEAEAYLLWGRNVSYSQNLPLFMISFSSTLGKLYCKKQSWDLAEKELETAKQTLSESRSPICCSKCKLLHEIRILQFLADLSCERGVRGKQNMSSAENLCRSALAKLNLPPWRNSVSRSIDARVPECSWKKTMPVEERTTSRRGTREHRKAKNERKKSQSSVPDCNSRLTRSRCRLLQSKCSGSSCQLVADSPKVLEGDDFRDWSSLASEVLDSCCIESFLHLKWEFIRRQLSARLLSSLVECLKYQNKIHESHEVILQGVSVIVSKDPSCHNSISVLLDLIGMEISGDVFAAERSAIIYDICWLSLKTWISNDPRTPCCDVCSILFPVMVSWLKVAFVLCREIPVIFQKVSRLLALLYLLSASREEFSLHSSCKTLSEGHWASYFHQASIGTQVNSMISSHLTSVVKSANHLAADEVSQVTTTHIMEELCSNFSAAPKSSQGLEEFVKGMFVRLPKLTVICLSLLGHDYVNLFQNLLPDLTCIRAWLVVSRLNSKGSPVAMLLPVNSILEDSQENMDELNGDNDDDDDDDQKECSPWICPWGFTVTDDVAPLFKVILEDNYLSSVYPLRDSKKSRTLWWMRRKKLDYQLGTFLLNLENSWFGSWKCMLMGELVDGKHLEMVHERLVRDLKFKCKFNVNEDLLKVILGGHKCTSEGETFISHLNSRDASFVAGVGYCDESKFGLFSNNSSGTGESSELAFELFYEAVNELERKEKEEKEEKEEAECIKREPIILVLDYDVQMLPWESLPVLRSHEVYRMPSVSSISIAVRRSNKWVEKMGRIVTSFPLIDPLDAFYLLNPTGDLRGTQACFEEWFRSQNMEGKAGSAPTVEELAAALEKHDLFIYFGHGSGVRYISAHEIQKLRGCAATFLMGCSSGSLTLNGSYAPQGAPLSYLTAGSPIIVANLWEVTDKDIDRFARAVLDAWLKQRSDLSYPCSRCNCMAEELQAMSIIEHDDDPEEKFPKKILLRDDDESNPIPEYCDHKPRIGSFMCQARQACTLPYLIGASPVCYGVPTGIARKKNLN